MFRGGPAGCLPGYSSAFSCPRVRSWYSNYWGQPIEPCPSPPRLSPDCTLDFCFAPVTFSSRGCCIGGASLLCPVRAAIFLSHRRMPRAEGWPSLGSRMVSFWVLPFRFQCCRPPCAVSLPARPPTCVHSPVSALLLRLFEVPLSSRVGRALSLLAAVLRCPRGLYRSSAGTLGPSVLPLPGCLSLPACTWQGSSLLRAIAIVGPHVAIP